MLFEPLVAPTIRLANRVVMAPMTRNRAIDANTPNALMAEYYGQRATAGLIITEGTSPSPNGLGYARIPGLFNEAQVRGWKPVVDAVHAKGGKIVRAADAHRPRQPSGQPAGRRRRCSARRPRSVPARCTPTRRACSRTAHRAR